MAIEDTITTGKKYAKNDIVALSAAIAYAALTDRLNDAVTMTDTLTRLVHAYTHHSMVAVQEAPITEETAVDYANALSAAVYVATERYLKWATMDSKDDS